jgi:3-isopropylmalate/(R)-2-methylmalate dehydratase small subunit
MIVEGPAVVVPGDNIDTDVLYPGAYLNIDDPREMKPHLFEGLDASLRDKLTPGCVVIVGENFGTGSSREHVPLGMKAFEVGCVVGVSFARIFYRNCFNLGLPAVVCPDAARAIGDGDEMRVDLNEGRIVAGDREFHIAPVPQFMRNMLSSGGLVEWGRARLEGELTGGR